MFQYYNFYIVIFDIHHPQNKNEICFFQFFVCQTFCLEKSLYKVY